MSPEIFNRNWAAAIALLTLLIAVGCGHGTNGAPIVGELELIADEACECPDAACANALRFEVMRRASAAGEIAGDDITKARAAIARMGRCMNRIFASESGDRR